MQAERRALAAHGLCLGAPAWCRPTVQSEVTMAHWRGRREMDEEGNPRKSRVRRKRDENLDRLDEGGGFQQRRLRDLNSNLYDKGEDKELSGIERDPEQFKANLNYIIDAYGCDLHDLAEKAGVEYRWLRRIVRKGLERRVNRLDRVASYLIIAKHGSLILGVLTSALDK